MAKPIELNLIADVCAENNLLAVSDEVYEHCVFPGHAHVPLSSRPGMRDRTITVSSGGKLFAATGWRVAWAYGPETLMRSVGAAHTHPERNL